MIPETVMLWEAAWVWLAGGVILAIIEVLVPGFFFLGFAIGAGLTGAVIFLGIPPMGWMVGSLPNHLVVFAILSLLAWLVLRQVFGVRKGQIKIWDKDINEED